MPYHAAQQTHRHLVQLPISIRYSLSNQRKLYWRILNENYREAIISVATELIGAPAVKYTYNHPELGQSPEAGFDCSGFVRFVLLQAGLHIPDYIAMDGVQRPIRHANEFWEHYGVPVHEPRKLPGDLIVFARGKRHPNHVGIVLSESTYIHSPGWPDMQVETQEIERIPIEYTSGERGQYTHNPIGYKAPVQVARQPTYRFPMRVIGSAFRSDIVSS